MPDENQNEQARAEHERKQNEEGERYQAALKQLNEEHDANVRRISDEYTEKLAQPEGES